MITVKDLKKLIKNMPNEAELVVSGSDHEYFRVHHVTVVDAEFGESGDLHEYYCDASMYEGSEKGQVVLVST